jgi:hypothetical protein
LAFALETWTCGAPALATGAIHLKEACEALTVATHNLTPDLVRTFPYLRNLRGA